MAGPGVVFVACPLKRTEAVDVRLPIERFLQNTPSGFDESCRIAVDEFARMRDAAVLRPPDRDESGIEALYTYYDQLMAMESKLPISGSQIRIRFTWYDAFAKKSVFSGKKESLHSSPFERTCLLFNVAALQSQIARGQNFDSDVGLKAAVKHFQGAAGVFYLVKEMASIHFSQPPLPDMTAAVLGALATTMLAQAQESLYHKTTLARMKNKICAKVAAQAGDLYLEAARLVRDPNVSKKLEREFVAIVTAKQPYFHGLAEYHEGLACKDEVKYGEAVARFRMAIDGMSEATKLGVQFFTVGNVFSRIQRALKQTETDNHIIYADVIPEPSKMAEIGRAALAKPMKPTFPASQHQDLFAQVVPMHGYSVFSTCESRKEASIEHDVKLGQAGQAVTGKQESSPESKKETAERKVETEQKTVDDVSDSEEDEERSGEERLGNTEWCLCGRCDIMPTATESICCCDMQENGKLDGIDCNDVKCITEHESFNTVCLEREVLRTALVCMSDVAGETGTESVDNRVLRMAAHRQFTWWVHDRRLGKQVIKVIPACVVAAIRRAYPEQDGSYIEGLNELPADY